MLETHIFRTVARDEKLGVDVGFVPSSPSGFRRVLGVRAGGAIIG